MELQRVLLEPFITSIARFMNTLMPSLVARSVSALEASISSSVSNSYAPSKRIWPEYQSPASRNFTSPAAATLPSRAEIAAALEAPSLEPSKAHIHLVPSPMNSSSEMDFTTISPLFAPSATATKALSSPVRSPTRSVAYTPLIQMVKPRGIFTPMAEPEALRVMVSVP